MTTRVGINGFGRIGRQAFKIALGNPELEVVAVNDIGDVENMAYLFKHDSVYHGEKQDVAAEGNTLVVDGKKFPVLSVTDPKKLPWHDLNVDVVIESTGRFASSEQAAAHLEAGAKAVVVSAPAKGAQTFVLGVNDSDYRLEEHRVLSNASCTTNSIAPVMAILDEKFGVQKAFLTTIHSYTADQRLVDSPHSDFRRGRAAAHNIVPTSTGAARAVSDALPQFKGIFDGVALRVPTIDVSMSDMTVLLKRKTTVEEINQVFREAAASARFKGILEATDEPLVSSDFIGNSHSSIVDLGLTQVVDGDFVKVFAWYDNEWGYANRLVEEVAMVGKAVQRQPAGAQA
ncbi:MAG: type I glyceraldehyde-3-phosphate dehydrogenase [Chloroflexota bacterium]|nr:MAG: type I glyceraldehyde-3-phosphate dehydrogenase [Chloroflexota bacterium]